MAWFLTINDCYKYVNDNINNCCKSFWSTMMKQQNTQSVSNFQVTGCYGALVKDKYRVAIEKLTDSKKVITVRFQSLLFSFLAGYRASLGDWNYLILIYLNFNIYLCIFV